MDYLRSCYTRRMRFVSGDPSFFANVVWYRAEPEAEDFPGLHKFGSAVWDNNRGMYTDLGDDASKPIVWSNGHNPNRSRGDDFAGPQEYFLQGAPEPTYIPRLLDGTPLECLSPRDRVMIVNPGKQLGCNVSILTRNVPFGVMKGCGYVLVH